MNKTESNHRSNYFEGKNEWAIILGGSSGIGLATAQKLAKEGMNLIILHRDRKQQTAQLASEIEQMKQHAVQILSFNLDATRAENRTKIIEKLIPLLEEQGKIKLLLHAISRGSLKSLVPTKSISFDHNISKASISSAYQAILEDRNQNHTTSDQHLSQNDFQITLESMALSLYDWVFALFEKGLFADDARVIGLTSEGGERAIPYYSAVSVAKGALEALCRSIALEFAPHGIRCNVVQAGVTKTPSLKMIPGSEHLKLQAVMRNPFKRLTKAGEVADVIYLLCRQESAWINGAIIPVDGGERIA